ncbi:hypothetical protein LCGC14_2514620 [marine sediment metagenome]|uniref:Uncharacterized protein n=1 Tax=marine sediment metagenome TaxID=412755 RepID=A0A0F9AY30_9ZZZZ
MMDILGIGKLVAGVVNGFGERRDRKSQRVHDEAMEDGKRITNMDENDAAYAIAKLKEQQGTWKDEVALLTIILPAWLSFMRWEDFFGCSFDGPAIVSAGFIALGQAPIWYQGLLTSGIGGALGLNEYAKHQKRSRLSVVKKKGESNVVTTD